MHNKNLILPLNKVRLFFTKNTRDVFFNAEKGIKKRAKDPDAFNTRECKDKTVIKIYSYVRR